MALYKIQNILHHVSGFPEDDVINTFHFDTAEAECTAAVGHALNGHVAAAYNAPLSGGVYPVTRWLAQSVRGGATPTVKAYDGEAGGSPIAVDTWAGGIGPGLDAESMPDEVALCLSFRGEYGEQLEEEPDGGDAGTAVDRMRSRKRGRIFIGPMSPSAGGGSPNRPQGPVIASLNRMANELGTIDVAPLTDAGVEAIWCVYGKSVFSGIGKAAYEVTNFWIDDEWDTQRRRGHAATSRTVGAF